MPKFLPMFPLQLVAFPGEQLNLNIFEPRYKELISECYKAKKTFGIPAFLDETVSELGTEMEILTVERVKKGGDVNVRTRGVRIFRILEFLKEVPNKKYSAGIISVHNTIEDSDVAVSSLVFGYLRQLQTVLNIHKPHFEKPSDISSFQIGHHVGLTLREEYDLLSYTKETDRMKFLANHLKKVLPVIRATEQMRERAKLNGHFRSEDPPKF